MRTPYNTSSVIKMQPATSALDLFFEPASRDEISSHTNIARRIIRVSYNILRLAAVLGLETLTPVLSLIKAPVSILNALLQIRMISTDNAYPTHLKKIMHVAIGMIGLSTFVFAYWLPSSLILSLALTLYSHTVRTVYRTSKLGLNIQKYQRSENEKLNNDQSLLKQGYQELIQQYHQLGSKHPALITQKKKFNKQLDHWLLHHQPLPLKQKKLKQKIMKDSIAVALIILRCIASTTLLLCASSMPTLVIPLVTAVLLINSCDLARNVHTKIQYQRDRRAIDKQKIEIITNLSLEHTNSPVI